MTQKGAMFGLDARIALAIFGALSVISGAALYSAIQQSKTTSLATTFTEIEKAVAAYILDTGIDLPNSGRYNHAQELVESTQEGWKGPYLDGSQVNTSSNIYISGLASGAWISILNQQNIDLGNVEKTILTDCVAGTKNCHYWIKAYTSSLGFGDSTDIINRLDEHFDGSDGLDKGKIRYTYYMDGSTLKPILYYQMMPLVTQP